MNSNVYTAETLTLEGLKSLKHIKGAIVFRPSVDENGDIQFFRNEDKSLRLDENKCPIPRYKMRAVTEFSDGADVFIGDIEWAVAKMFYQYKVIGKMEGSSWLKGSKIEIKLRNDKTCSFKTADGIVDVPLPVLRLSAPDAFDSGL